MVKANSSLRLRVEVGGGGQVGHVGLWLLGRFAGSYAGGRSAVRSVRFFGCGS